MRRRVEAGRVGASCGTVVGLLGTVRLECGTGVLGVGNTSRGNEDPSGRRRWCHGLWSGTGRIYSDEHGGIVIMGPPGQVITGWDQGLLGMQIGEQRKLEIPAHEGYGDQGFPAWGRSKSLGGRAV